MGVKTASANTLRYSGYLDRERATPWKSFTTRILLRSLECSQLEYNYQMHIMTLLMRWQSESKRHYLFNPPHTQRLHCDSCRYNAAPATSDNHRALTDGVVYSFTHRQIHTLSFQNSHRIQSAGATNYIHYSIAIDNKYGQKPAAASLSVASIFHKHFMNQTVDYFYCDLISPMTTTTTRPTTTTTTEKTTCTCACAFFWMCTNKNAALT